MLTIRHQEDEREREHLVDDVELYDDKANEFRKENIEIVS